MPRRLYLLILISCSLLILQCERDERALHRKLSEMAVGLNESAPVMLDRYTRFDEASVTSENVFRYHYTVMHSDNPDSLLEKRREMLMKHIKTMFNENADLRIFTENSVVIEYIYRDTQKKELRSIRVNPEDYQ